jgi:5'-3' exonuclease
MIVHLIDGTYELFRHFYGIRRFKKTDPPFGAVSGVLNTIARMIEDGATHLGVATDHVIESFRNSLWPGYKTGAGIERVLLAQFHPLEEALAAMGVVVWPMIELEADDALASAAHLAKDKRVEKVCIWTPDKDLAQCVVGDRVVQIDRRKNEIRDEHAIRAKFGVAPEFIADYLALVGDSADGYPGIAGLGPKTSATLIKRYGHIEQFPAGVLASKDASTSPGQNKVKRSNRELSNLERALLFKNLATLRTDAPLFRNVDELRWSGPAASFSAFTEKMGDARLASRVEKLQAARNCEGQY